MNKNTPIAIINIPESLINLRDVLILMMDSVVAVPNGNKNKTMPYDMVMIPKIRPIL